MANSLRPMASAPSFISSSASARFTCSRSDSSAEAAGTPATGGAAIGFSAGLATAATSTGLATTATGGFSAGLAAAANLAACAAATAFSTFDRSGLYVKALSKKFRSSVLIDFRSVRASSYFWAS